MGAALATLAGIGTSVGGASMSMASCVACQACSCASSVACNYLCGSVPWPQSPAVCSGRARGASADVRARAVRAHCRSSRCARNPARRAHARRRARRPQRVGADAVFLLWFVPTCFAARCAGPRPRRKLSRTRRESSILGCSSSPSSARGSSVTTSRPSSARLQTTSSGERAVLHAAMRSQ
jgi:hypothetical protein